MLCFSGQAHRVYRGEEALGLMQSRAGVTAKSLVRLKQALDMINDPAAVVGGDEVLLWLASTIVYDSVVCSFAFVFPSHRNFGNGSFVSLFLQPACQHGLNYE